MEWGVLQVHDSIARTVDRWIEEVGGVMALYNQRVPEWDALLEQAELDVKLKNSSGQPVYIDLSIVDPPRANADLLRRRARAAVSGIRIREKAEHTR